MFDLFLAMMKEEWRIHSSIFGNLGFALFPVMLAAFSAAGTLILPVFLTVIPADKIALLAHALFLLLGVMVGSFGVLGREFMNRRFGQASLVAYSSRSLPVSERRIFAAFVIKDALYYIVLWVLPFILGFAVASPFLGIGSGVAATLLVSLPLALLLGLSWAFFLSAVYARSIRALIAVLAALALICGLPVLIAGADPAALLLPYLFYASPGAGVLAACLLMILALSGFAVLFVRFDYPDRTKRFPNALTPLASRLGRTPRAPFIAKDALDLLRSEGGVGKILFSFLFPLGLIWIFLSVLMQFIPGIDGLVVFAVLLGVISSTTYNWLTEFETFSSYAFLPVEVGTVMKSKISSYAAINLVSLGVLLVAVAGTGLWGSLVPALATFGAVSLYALAVTIYLTGLSPNVLLYHARVFFWYLAGISPVLLGLIFISVVDPWYALGSLLLVPPALLLLKKSLDRWNEWEIPSF